MDHQELKRLVELMNENELVELEVEAEGFRVALRKAGAFQATFQAPAPVAAAAAPAVRPAEGQTPSASAPAGPPPGTRDIVSPMVGTFYRRPSPESPPYVDVGSRVSADSVVCVVEAMKVNNEIKAELSGEIVEVLVEDGQPVEFDQPLFRVRVA